ncbi:MAG: hypothetical protein ABIZ70_04595, partial [Gemmatimonadales bacterium]
RKSVRKLNIPNATLMALVASCFIQIGAQMFALSIVAHTVAQAPPRSFAMFQGPYGYNSNSFWETVPPITGCLFLIALAANWKTRRRGLLLVALVVFVLGGVLAGIFLEPTFAEMMATGYRDAVDPALQRRAANWYALDWAVWSTGLIAGGALLLALARPADTDR